MRKRTKSILFSLTIICMMGSLACTGESAQSSPAAALYPYDIEEKIADLGYELRDPGNPVANYVHAVRSGNLVFLSGKGPRLADGSFVTGKLGGELTIEEGYEAAQLVALEQLSALKSEIGDLNKVVRIVKVLGMVNADPSFNQHSKVVNGFSDLMVEVFGDRGKHARAAVGMASLPLDFACEIEMIVEIAQ